MFEKLEVMDSRNHIVGECPMWDERAGTLYYVDILGKCFYRMDYASGKSVKTELPQQIGCLAFCDDGDLILSMQDGIYFMNPQGKVCPAHTPTVIKGRRFNDGKVGPDGMYYVGTTDDNHQGAFYRLNNGKLTELFDRCGCSNGLDWSADGGTLYYCDSRRQKVEQFDFSWTAHGVSNRRQVLEVPIEFGSPDGMAIDARGNLWTAVWGDYAVWHIEAKTGKLLEKIKLPVERVSSCCFAGPDLQDLIITTAAHQTDLKAQPQAGNVFRLRCEVPGVLGNRYKKGEESWRQE